MLVVGKEEIERLARLEPVEELEDVPEEPEVAIEVEKDDEPEHEREVMGGGRQLFEPLAEGAKRGSGHRGSGRVAVRNSSVSGWVRARGRGVDGRRRFAAHPIPRQIVPAAIACSIQGMTSSSMASSEVVAAKPRTRCAFSTEGTRR